MMVSSDVQNGGTKLKPRAIKSVRVWSARKLLAPGGRIEL